MVSGLRCLPKHRDLCLSLSVATWTLNVGEMILAKSANPKVDKNTRFSFFGSTFLILYFLNDLFPNIEQ